MAQTKQRTRRQARPTRQVLPPTPTDHRSDDFASPHKVNIDETGEAFDFLGSLADLMSCCSPEDLDQDTVKHVGYLMQEIAGAGKAHWERESEERWGGEAELRKRLKSLKRHAHSGA
jgi:hypothetical protein